MSIISHLAPYGFPIISLGVALVTVMLRRVYGLRYWMVPLCVAGLSIGAVPWMAKGYKAVFIFLFALPTSLAFATAGARTLRARPWLVIIVVPLLFLATIFVGLVVGVNLGALNEP